MPGHIYRNSSLEPFIPLKIVIVGGNIAGLASAYTLAKAGHDVLLIEKSDGKRRSHGGLRAPPNMTKILNQWGLGPSLQQFGHKCDKFIFQSGGSGDAIATMIMGEDFMRDLLSDFIFIQHGDLHSMLYELACQEGVAFRFNTRVTQVDPISISVTLESGEELFTDVIVGADGYKSIVRPVVTGHEDFRSSERESVFTFIVPADAMEEDEDLRSLLKGSNWSLWLGDGYIFHGNPIGAGRDYCVILCQRFQEGSPSNSEKSEWEEPPTIEQIHIDCEKLEPSGRIRKLLKLGSLVFSRTCTTQRPLESLVCDQARIVLVGEAAHPLVPVGHHSTALAIEDAQTLGGLFSRIRSRDQISQLLIAYEDIRQPRAATVQAYEHDQRTMLILPPCPEQQARDAMLREAMAVEDWEHMDEAIFKATWADELDLFAHDATEKVDDWWTKWGSLLVRGTPNGAINMMPSLEVSVSKNDSADTSVG